MSRSRWQEPKVKIRRNKSGAVYWSEYWVYEPQPDGTERREHRSVVLGACDRITKTEAKQKLAEQVRKPPQTSRTWTVGRWVKEVWLPFRLKRWAHNSKDALMPLINNHVLPAFGVMPVGDVRRFHLEAHFSALREHGYSLNTAKMIRGLERNLFDDLEENGLIEKSPARRAELPVMAPAKRTPPYTIEEARLLASIPGIEGLALRTLLLCGLRPGELLSLRRRDLIGGVLVVSESTDHAGHYKATKTHRTRPVPLASKERQDAEFLRWPKYEAAWKRAIIANWTRWKDVPNTKTGMPRFHAKFETGEEFWRWWRDYHKPEGASCQREFLWTNE